MSSRVPLIIESPLPATGVGAYEHSRGQGSDPNKIISRLTARDPHTFATPLLWVKRNGIGSGEMAGGNRWLNGGAVSCALDRLYPGPESRKRYLFS